MSSGSPDKLTETGVWDEPGAAFGRQDSFLYGLPGDVKKSGDTVTIPYPMAAWLKQRGIFKPTNVVVNFLYRADSILWRADSITIRADAA